MNFTILCKTRKCPPELTLYARKLFVITDAQKPFHPIKDIYLESFQGPGERFSKYKIDNLKFSSV